MEDELRKMVENRRKRKYLKSDEPVPKRTKQHWENAKQQADISSQNIVTSCGSGESSKEINHNKQQDLHGIQSSLMTESDKADPNLYEPLDPCTARNDLCVMFMGIQQQFAQIPSASQADVVQDQTGGSSAFRSNSSSCLHSTAQIENENLHERGQQFQRGNAEASQEDNDEDWNRELDGSPGSSPPNSSDSENCSSSSSSSFSEDETDNNHMGDDSNAHEQSNYCNEEVGDNNSQERNTNEQETGANDQEMEGNEEDLENGRNEEDFGNGRNQEDMGNGINQEDLGNGINQEDLGGRNNEQDPNRRPHSKLQEWIDSPVHNQNVTTPVNITQLDLLYMILGMSKQNNFTNKAFNDAIKLINKIFVNPVLPRSPYLIDQLVMSHTGTRYFFFCEQCAHDFGELEYESIKEIVCPTCNTVNCISDLRNAHYFCLFDVRCALETLLSDEEIRQALLTPTEAVQTTRDGVFTDIYSGSMYKKFVENFGNAALHVVSFHLNTDGSPLFSSSKCSIWPISLALDELPLNLRMSNLICAGLWFGKKKPPMDLFLKPFVSHMSELARGFEIRVGAENWNMCAYVIGVSVDSGARGAVQGLKTHSGYDSCSWCCIHGVYLAGAVRFPLSNIVHRLRCHDDIVRMQYELVNEQHVDDIGDDDEDDDDSTYGGGVNAVSPLINLPGLDMANGFFVEGMHCLHLGVTKYALLKWLEDYGCEYYIKDFADEINKRIKSLRPPIECRRMPRTLDEKARYKARELENLLLFCIVPVLTNILPDKHIKIWLLFAQAVYLLCLTEILAGHVNTADALLKKFLLQWQETYGEASMTFNLHLLYHLAEHVSRWGNIFASSAYCFEDFIGLLKRVIRSQQGIPNQVVRSLSWEQALTLLKPHVSEKARLFVESAIASRNPAAGLRVGAAVLSGKPKLFTPSDEEKWLCEREGIDTNSCDQYNQVIHNKCVFAPDKQTRETNNSVAQLNDKRLVLIRKIVFDRVRSIIFLFVSLVHFETLLNDPDIAIERDDHLMRLINHVEPNSMLIKCEELKIVCFRATFEHGDFVAPLPNVFNRN